MTTLWRLPVLVLVFLVWAPPAFGWSWPVDGPVLQPYVYDESHPYAAGQHRGIDIGADSAGDPVVAPAAGTVAFAGSVPTSGRCVTVETADGYSVTLTHLGSIGVKKGATVAEGDVVGTVGPSGTPEIDGAYVHLGIRLTADPLGYVDPVGLLPALGPPPPPAPAHDPGSAETSAPGAAPAPPPPAPTDSTAPAPDEPAAPADPAPASPSPSRPRAIRALPPAIRNPCEEAEDLLPRRTLQPRPPTSPSSPAPPTAAGRARPATATVPIPAARSRPAIPPPLPSRRVRGMHARPVGGRPGPSRRSRSRRDSRGRMPACARGGRRYRSRRRAGRRGGQRRRSSPSFSASAPASWRW